ncbi:hypothetical protein [Bifidobacterium canis]|uniref:Uncharacterized protein n=1 Tax=Bifidobacterium canis TaxID=2610880 RepID=A0A7K1J7M5_9BIFI|nr:hypothetical protein [Bifidobacterium canis]MUH60587.1 hypothetical protein [Bifidobacterium canis]
MQLMEALDKAALKLSHYAIGNVTEWNDYWLFHPMDPDDPDTAILDPPVIKINKKTGEESLSTITDPDWRSIMKESKLVQMPEGVLPYMEHYTPYTSK